MHNEHPQLLTDIYWDTGLPQEIPYTIASEQFMSQPPEGSAEQIKVPEEKQKLLPPVLEYENEAFVNEPDINSTHTVDMKVRGISQKNL